MAIDFNKQIGQLLIDRIKSMTSQTGSKAGISSRGYLFGNGGDLAVNRWK